MLLHNAITRLEKNGYKVSNHNNSLYFATKQNRVIDFVSQTDEDGTVISAIRTRQTSDVDDSQHDYFAGVCVNNLAQALRLSENN